MTSSELDQRIRQDVTDWEPNVAAIKQLIRDVVAEITPELGNMENAPSMIQKSTRDGVIAELAEAMARLGL